MRTSSGHSVSRTADGSDEAAGRLQERLEVESEALRMQQARNLNREETAGRRREVSEWVRGECAKKLQFAGDLNAAARRRKQQQQQQPAFSRRAPGASSSSLSPSPSPPPPARRHFSRSARSGVSTDAARETAVMARFRQAEGDAEQRRAALQSISEKDQRAALLVEYKAARVQDVRQSRFASRERRQQEERERRSAVQRHDGATRREMSALLAAEEQRGARAREAASRTRLRAEELARQKEALLLRRRQREEAAALRAEQAERRRRDEESRRVATALRRARSASPQSGCRSVRGRSAGGTSSSVAASASLQRVAPIQGAAYNRLLGKRAEAMEAVNYASAAAHRRRSFSKAAARV